MNKRYQKKAEEFARRWLRGSTCHSTLKNKLFWQSDNGRFVIMKHAGHSEWVGRFTPHEWCGTHYSLYELDSDERIDCLGQPTLKRWEGRWVKKYWDEVKQTIEENS